MSKEDLKESGKDLGKAFKTLGKTFLRSVDRTAENLGVVEEDSIDENGNTVFSDGSWKETGKELGKSLAGMAKNVVKTVNEEINEKN